MAAAGSFSAESGKVRGEILDAKLPVKGCVASEKEIRLEVG